MNIITGYRGEPHITSSQDRAKNQGTFGTGSYILDVGQKLNVEIVSANEIRIRDGVLSHQGCIANIEQGAYDSLEISNGSQGMQRRDLIVARYTKDAETNIEDISLVVIEGTPAASSPADPSYNTGNIQSGDSPVDMPLYRVNINGTTISGTTLLASTVRTQAETDALLGNTSISGIDGGTVTGALSMLNTNYSNTVRTATATVTSSTNGFRIRALAGSVVSMLVFMNSGFGHVVLITRATATSDPFITEVAGTLAAKSADVAADTNNANFFIRPGTSGRAVFIYTSNNLNNILIDTY